MTVGKDVRSTFRVGVYHEVDDLAFLVVVLVIVIRSS
jgi:hypothetical protein